MNTDRYTVEYDPSGKCWVLTDTATWAEIGRDGGEPEDQILVRDWGWVPDLLNRLDREHTEEVARFRADLDLTTKAMQGAVYAANEAVEKMQGLRAALAARDAECARLRDRVDAWRIVAPVMIDGFGFCPECGVVQYDEDGCCVLCGATATGTAIDEMRKRISDADAMEAADRAAGGGR